MSGDSWANVRVSDVALEVLATKDLLGSKKYRLSRFWKGSAIGSDITITMTGRTRIKRRYRNVEIWMSIYRIQLIHLMIQWGDTTDVMDWIFQQGTWAVRPVLWTTVPRHVQVLSVSGRVTSIDRHDCMIRDDRSQFLGLINKWATS